MQKWRDFDFGYLGAMLLAFPFMGFIYGLVVYAAVGVVLDAPLWPLGLSCFFSIFHWGDLRRMGWYGRILRVVWIFIMAAVVCGVVWVVIPKEDWVRPQLLTYATLLLPPGFIGGFFLGVIEGIKPHSVRRHLDHLAKEWKNVGGY